MADFAYDEEEEEYDEEFAEELEKQAAAAAQAQAKGPAQAPNLVDRIFGADFEQEDKRRGNQSNGKKKKAQIAQWPFDNYHELQQKYYEVVDNAKLHDEPNQSYVTRPPDLQDIPATVQGLPLSDFADTAEQRAIGIISTWIFDAGLIDELLMESQSPAAARGGPGGAGGAGAGGGKGKSGKNKSHAKIDKEVFKLRESTAQELALINNRLNDGVAASGSEVQELVNAVQDTKDNLAKLRKLSKHIANGGDPDTPHKFLLTEYPKLQTSIHARRNLHRCFQEMEFYTQIKPKCQRLRDELNSCEWTVHEWDTIRNVCREHVVLQIGLVQAETELHKRRLSSYEDPPIEPEYDHNGQPIVSSDGGLENYETLRRFLDNNIKIVWDLGAEIELRVLNGVENALKLAAQTPAGMVALVEAVECYEDAADEFKRVHGGVDPTKQTDLSADSLNERPMHSITEMRKLALQHIARDFEMKANLQFTSGIKKAIEEAGDEDEYGGVIDHKTPTFNAILKAANTLTRQIDTVKKKLSPCFPPFWSIETLWLTCVAAVCSKYILKEIGSDGLNLDASNFPTQLLLDLVAWIESFREQVRQQFPEIVKITKDDDHMFEELEEIEMAELMKNDEFDTETAKNLLGRVTKILWNVKKIAQQSFLNWAEEKVDEWLSNVYVAEHQHAQTTEGLLTTSLPEDLYGLAGVQMRTIQQRLTKKSSVLAEAVGVVFTKMKQKQREMRDSRLKDIEECCAAANDFLRMVDQCEAIVDELVEKSDLTEESEDFLRQISDDLCQCYTSDAVYAAQRIHKFIFDDLEADLGHKMFEDAWELQPNNDLALTIVRTLEDWMEDIEVFLEEPMVRKAVDGLVKATVNFYLKHLIRKSGKKGGRKESCFENNKNAMSRIKGDVDKIRMYFEGLVPQFPALRRVILQEFSTINTVFGILWYADDPEAGEIEILFPAVQKTVKDVNITKIFVGDLYHLVNPDGEKKMYETFAEHEEELKHIQIKHDHVDKHYEDEDLQLAHVIISTVKQSTRRRPIPGETLKNMGLGGIGWFGGGKKAAEEVVEQTEEPESETASADGDGEEKEEEAPATEENAAEEKSAE